MSHQIYGYIAMESNNYEFEPVAFFIAKHKLVKWAKENDKPETCYLRIREGGEESFLTDITKEIKGKKNG